MLTAHPLQRNKANFYWFHSQYGNCSITSLALPMAEAKHLSHQQMDCQWVLACGRPPSTLFTTKEIQCGNNVKDSHPHYNNTDSFRPSTLHVLPFAWCCALNRQGRCERHCGDSCGKPKLSRVPPALRILSRLNGPVSAVHCRMMLFSQPSSYCGKLFWKLCLSAYKLNITIPYTNKPKEKGAGGIANRVSACLKCL